MQGGKSEVFEIEDREMTFSQPRKDLRCDVQYQTDETAARAELLYDGEMDGPIFFSSSLSYSFSF